MDDKDENHHDELNLVIEIVPINEKSMNQIIKKFYGGEVR
jgi:hypothetical protein